MGMTQHGKTFLSVIILIIAVVILVSMYKMSGIVGKIQEPVVTPKTELPIFTKTISELGLDVDRLSGYTVMSPNGKYLFFGALRETGDNINAFFLADLTTGKISEISAFPVRDFAYGDTVLLQNGQDLFIVEGDFANPTKINIGTDFFNAILSPNKKLIMVNSMTGLYVYNRDTKALDHMTTKQYDGAYAWFSDSNRILGFKATNEKLPEGNDARELVMWNVSTKEGTPVGVNIPLKNIRVIDWLEQDKIAKVNAGYDDGSFDYIVNLDTKKVSDLGETSGMLMGMKVDPALGLYGAAGYIFENGKENGIVKVFDKTGDVREVRFGTDGYMRQVLNFIDKDTVIYMRKKMSGSNNPSEIVVLDLNTKIERVIGTHTENLFGFAVTSDRSSYIIATSDRILLNKIQ